MDTHAYSRHALTTATMLGAKPDFAHAVLGLMSELTEVTEAKADKHKLADECGDVLWYVNLAASSTRLLFEDIVSGARTDIDMHGKYSEYQALTTLSTSISILADVGKKWLIADRAPDQNKVRSQLIHIVAAVLSLLIPKGVTLELVLEINIQKLSVRYPNLKFEARNALNHDKEAERAAQTKVLHTHDGRADPTLSFAVPNDMTATMMTPRNSFASERLNHPENTCCGRCDSSSDSSSSSSDSSCGGGE